MSIRWLESGHTMKYGYIFHGMSLLSSTYCYNMDPIKKNIKILAIISYAKHQKSVICFTQHIGANTINLYCSNRFLVGYHNVNWYVRKYFFWLMLFSWWLEQYFLKIINQFHCFCQSFWKVWHYSGRVTVILSFYIVQTG